MTVLGTAVLLFAVGAWASGGVSPPTPSLGESLPPSTLERPVLTSVEQADAIEALQHYKPLQDVMIGSKYSITAIGPWTGDNLKIGASVEFKLNEPLDVSLVWPYIQYEGITNDKAVYEKLETLAIATGVTELHALVDLETKTVVALQPTSFEAISYEEEEEESASN